MSVAEQLAAALDLAEQQASSINLACDWYTPGDLSRNHREGGAGLPEFDEAHIVAWSPKRVLALIARDRVLLTVHYRMTPDDPERMLDDLRDGRCSACLPPDEPGASMYVPWPCPSIRLAADFWLVTETADA